MSIVNKGKLNLSRFPIEILLFMAFAAFWLVQLDDTLKKSNELHEAVASSERVGMPTFVKYEKVPIGNGMRDRTLITTERGVFVANGIMPYRNDRQVEIQKRKSGEVFLCYNSKDCYEMLASAQ